MNPRFHLLALLAVVVLAGCTFGIDDREPLAPGAQAETDDSPVTLANHTLDIDGELVFERVRILVDEDVAQPPVRVVTPDDGPDGDGTFAGGPPDMPEMFANHLGLLNVSAGAGTPAGFADAQGFVYLVEGSGSEQVMEQVLVHEYAHSIQFRSSMLEWRGAGDGIPTTDAYLTRQSIIEGGAVYVADEYTREYMADADIRPQSAQIGDSYADGTPGDRFLFAPYLFGPAYFDTVLDSPADFRWLHETPPATTSHVLHGIHPDKTVVQSLSVNVTDSQAWELRDGDGSDVVGEMATRIALSGTLDDETAGSAATGWAGDRLYAFDHEAEGVGFAWALRWNDAANASEFATAFEEFAEEGVEQSATSLERVDDETVVVFLGPETFLQAGSVAVPSEGSDKESETGNIEVDIGTADQFAATGTVAITPTVSVPPAVGTAENSGVAVAG